MPRVVACPLGRSDAAGQVPAPVRPAGAVLCGGLGSWLGFAGPWRWLRWLLVVYAVVTLARHVARAAMMSGSSGASFAAISRSARASAHRPLSWYANARL